MRKLVVAPWLAIPLLLAGCGQQSAPEGPPAAAAPGMPVPAATVVTGTVSLQTKDVPVTPGARLELSLVDVTQQPGVTINKQDLDSPKFPQSFRLPFSPSAINPNDLYVLQAVMQDNGRTWTTKLQQPVLTRGQPASVDLALFAEPTAAEKMLADFEQAKRQTGGMTVKTGTASKIGESRSWQVFSDVHGVEFIIQQINQADKGFTKTEYAYRNGRPWVVVQEQMPTQGAPATSTERAGWDDSGALVLQELVSGGKTTVLPDSDAHALNNEAFAELKKFAKQH